MRGLMCLEDKMGNMSISSMQSERRIVCTSIVHTRRSTVWEKGYTFYYQHFHNI